MNAFHERLFSALYQIVEYRYLHSVTDSDKARGRYLYWLTVNVVRHDRLMRGDHETASTLCTNQIKSILVRRAAARVGTTPDHGG